MIGLLKKKKKSNQAIRRRFNGQDENVANKGVEKSCNVAVPSVKLNATFYDKIICMVLFLTSFYEFSKYCKKVKSGIMIRLYSPDKVVERSIFFSSRTRRDRFSISTL